MARTFKERLAEPKVENPRLAAALEYAALGIPVFPCRPNDKRPATENGFHACTTDEARIRAWWAENPNYNVACPTGHKFDVIDIDPDGFQAFGELDTVAGYAVAVTTPRRGNHLYVRRGSLPTTANIRKGIDTRGEGGYVLMPPSEVDGNFYRFVSGRDLSKLGDIPDAPAWVVAAVMDRPRGIGSAETPETVTEGERNQRLFLAASSMRGRGHTVAEIREYLSILNKRCVPPLPEDELDTIARSTGRYEQGQANVAKVQASVVAGIESYCATDPETGEVRELPVFEQSQVGNAIRMAAIYGSDLLWVNDWGAWVRWDGKRWEIDRDGGHTVRGMAQTMFRDMIKEGANLGREGEDLIKWGMKCQCKAQIDACVELLKAQPGMLAGSDSFDSNPNILNVANGRLSLTKEGLESDSEFKVEPHDRNDFATKLIPISYDPSAYSEAWARFLIDVQPVEELRTFLMTAAGYSLGGWQHERCFFFLYGSQGANGKSVFTETLGAIMGDYACQTRIETFLDTKYGSGIPNDIARLRGTRYVVAPEAGEGKRLSEELIKQVTGGDKLTARFMRAEFFDFQPAFTLWLTGNHKPDIRGTDNAIWQRPKLIPFNVQISPDRQDKGLKARLTTGTDAEGVLNWMLTGCASYLRSGLAVPEVVRQATAEYREEMDVLGRFLSDETVEDSLAEVQAGELYKRYTLWCEEQGNRPVSLTKVGQAIRERSIEVVKRSGFKWVQGLRLVEREPGPYVYRGGE